jgi:hypothetical protein
VASASLALYLESKRSPLAPHAEEVLESPYWSLLIAITYVEQSFYKQPTSSPFNLWGRMFPRCCILKKYESFPVAIADMTLYFSEFWEGRRDVHHVENLNGSYCYNGNYPGNRCPGWTEGVLKVINEVESLP